MTPRQDPTSKELYREIEKLVTIIAVYKVATALNNHDADKLDYYTKQLLDLFHRHSTEQVREARKDVPSLVGRWLTLRQKNYPSHPNAADADHSTLLQALLDGHEPLTDEEYALVKAKSPNEYERRVNYQKALESKELTKENEHG